METTNPSRVRRGELFLIEEGVHSARTILACFRVLRNFDPFERLRVFTKMYPDMANPLNSEGFISWLEFRQPVKLVTRAKASIFSLEALPYGDFSNPAKFSKIVDLPNLTINPSEDQNYSHRVQVESEPGEKE